MWKPHLEYDNIIIYLRVTQSSVVNDFDLTSPSYVGKRKFGFNVFRKILSETLWCYHNNNYFAIALLTSVLSY